MKWCALFIIAILIIPPAWPKEPTSGARSDGEVNSITDDQKKQIIHAIDRLNSVNHNNACSDDKTSKASDGKTGVNTADQKTEVLIHECSIDEKENTPSPEGPLPTINKPMIYFLAKDHPLRQKFGFDTVRFAPKAKEALSQESIGIDKNRISYISGTISHTNDNNLFHISTEFINRKLGTKLELPENMQGDDYGFTFGQDANVSVGLVNQMKINLSSGTRLYTREIEGNSTDYGDYDKMPDRYRPKGLSKSNPTYHQLYDAKTRKILLIPRDQTIEKNKKLQKGIAVNELNLEVEIPGNKTDLGLSVGMKELSDEENALGKKIQQGWHKATDIYQFDNKALEKLVIGGMHRYLTLGGKVKSKDITLEKTNCRVSASAEVGAVVNVPISKDAIPLNVVQPYASGDVSVGLVKLKRNHEMTRYELSGQLLLDPWNQTPNKREMGSAGMATMGLTTHHAIGKNGTLSWSVVQVYVPFFIGNQEKNSLLDQNELRVKSIAGEIKSPRQEEVLKEITADWGVITYRHTFNQPKKPSKPSKK